MAVSFGCPLVGTLSELNDKVLKVGQRAYAIDGIGTKWKTGDGIQTFSALNWDKNEGGDSNNVVDGLENYYTKEEVDAKISTVFKYCGSVEFEHDLPNYKVGENVGHVYNILKSNDDLNEPKPLIRPSVNDVEWYGKVSLINDIQYLTVKDKNGNDITQSLPSGIMLQHSELESINDFSQFLILVYFRLDTKTDNGWTFSVDNEQSFEMMADKVNITFERCMQDFLEPKAGDNVVWNGYMWDNLSGTIDLSNYYTKEEVNDSLADKQDIGNMFTGNLTDFAIDYFLGEELYPNINALKYYVNDKLSSYETKTDFPDPPTPDDEGRILFDFSDMYNKELRLHTAPSIAIVFQDDVYPEDYISGLSFNSGEKATGFDYADSGIINWVGTDCVKSGDLSIFQPSANTHYDIIFYFNGTQFIGLVNGFVPATGNVVSEQ